LAAAESYVRMETRLSLTGRALAHDFRTATVNDCRGLTLDYR